MEFIAVVSYQRFDLFNKKNIWCHRNKNSSAVLQSEGDNREGFLKKIAKERDWGTWIHLQHHSFAVKRLKDII